MSFLDKIKKDKAERQERASQSELRTVGFSKAKETIIRLYPSQHGADEIPYMDYGQHFVRAKEGEKPTVVPCLSISNPEHNCPVCNAYYDNFNAAKTMGDTKLNFYKKAKATPRVLWSGKQVEEHDGNTIKKLSDTVVFEMPTSVFKQVQEQLLIQMEEEERDPLDPEKGFCFLVEKSGTGLDTEYTVRAKPKMICAITDEEVKGQIELQRFADDMKLKDILTSVQRINKLVGVSAVVTPESLELPPAIAEKLGAPEGTPAIESKAKSDIKPDSGLSTTEDDALAAEIAAADDEILAMDDGVEYKPDDEKSESEAAPVKKPTGTDDLDAYLDGI